MAQNISKYVSIDPSAEVHPDVHIGPFCAIGPNVKIGKGTYLEPNVTILSHVTLGENCRISSGTVLGGFPQDQSFRGTDTRVEIGDNCTFRENVTINRASEKEDGITRVGDDCFFMAGAHVGHDCVIGNGVIMANNVMLGGHVHIDDRVTIAGAAAVHQFATIGNYAFVGGLSAARLDVPPYMFAEGNPARTRTVNIVGLQRNGYSMDTIRALGSAQRLLFRAKIGVDAAFEQMKEKGKLTPEVLRLFEFVRFSNNGSKGRGREAIRRKAA